MDLANLAAHRLPAFSQRRRSPRRFPRHVRSVSPGADSHRLGGNAGHRLGIVFLRRSSADAPFGLDVRCSSLLRRRLAADDRIRRHRCRFDVRSRHVARRRVVRPRRGSSRHVVSVRRFRRISKSGNVRRYDRRTRGRPPERRGIARGARLCRDSRGRRAGISRGANVDRANHGKPPRISGAGDVSLESRLRVLGRNLGNADGRLRTGDEHASIPQRCRTRKASAKRGSCTSSAVT